jgi:hypothetical protein
LIELCEVVFDHAQFFEGELHEPPIHRVEIGARAKGVAQLVGYVGFLEERLQPVVQLDAAARDLVLASHHRAPQPLLGSLGPGIPSGSAAERAPAGRGRRIRDGCRVVAEPVLGGLHHEYRLEQVAV